MLSAKRWLSKSVKEEKLKLKYQLQEGRERIKAGVWSLLEMKLEWNLDWQGADYMGGSVLGIPLSLLRAVEFDDAFQ